MLQDTIKNNENVQVNSKEMEALKEHFPQCFDASGNFDMAIFEELVKTKDISIKKEGYALNFLGKSYARYLSNLESETVIVPDESNKDNPSENIYIVGDNLDALQHLKHSYAGAIKCIYIDPPYNTGSDGFVYNDKFEFSAKDLAEKIGIEEDEAERVLNLQGKSTHSAWLTFMYPRLELAKELLSEDGVIFISIDDNEQANCKLLCDAVFGEVNFITNLAIENNPKGRKNGKFFSINYENCLVYAKNIFVVDKFNNIIPKEKMKKDEIGYYSDGQRVLVGNSSNPIITNKKSDKFYYVYYDKNKNQIEIRKELDLSFNNYKLYRSINNDGEIIENTYTIDKFKELFLGNNLIFKEDTIYEKDRELFKQQKTLINSTSLYDLKTESANFIDDIFDLRNIFTMPKNIGYIIMLLKLISSNDCIILDFFSGSATTAHAVMLNNVTDDKKIKYIMVQLNEPVKKGSEAEKAGYKTIDEIGRERIRRAAAKVRADEPEKSKDVDLGFKTYYLKTPEKQTLDKIESFNPEFPIDGDDIIAAFGKDTVLATWGIKDGYGFNTPIKEIDLKGYTAYLVNDGIHGANLYLLDEISEPSIMELVRRLEANELVADKIIVYGYALSYTASASLRTNLKTLKNRNPIDVVIRY